MKAFKGKVAVITGAASGIGRGACAEPVPLTPEMQAGLPALKAAMETSMPPPQVADAVFDAIQQEQFYILLYTSEGCRMRP
jgi:hypothetical protein